jgi:hypothetical protein
MTADEYLQGILTHEAAWRDPNYTFSGRWAKTLYYSGIATTATTRKQEKSNHA